MFPNEGRNTFFSELLSVWRLVSDEFEARDPATFLVDGYDRLDPRQISQVLDKLPKLRECYVQREYTLPAVPCGKRGLSQDPSLGQAHQRAEVDLSYFVP